jgi:hypothetical protein
MGVHLLGQLAGDLDGLHLRRKGTAEYPFDEVLDPLLEISQNADPKLLVRGGEAAAACGHCSVGQRILEC